MNLAEVRAAAKEKLKGSCRLCPVCDGRACAGEVPGMGGIGTGASFIANVEALRRRKLNLRTLHDVVEPDTTADLFGRKLAAPILGAPMAGTKPNIKGVISDYDITKAVVKGCRLAGTAGMSGDTGKVGLQVLQEEEGHGFFIFKPREQEKIIRWAQSAAEVGAIGFGIDVDGAGLINMRLLGMFVEPKTGAKLKELVANINLPFIVKGIMTPDEAEIAADAGASAIVVSNHGGRVLDSTPGAADVLPAIAARVKGRITIMADGGVRSGSDVLKLLALGADHVLVGRPLLQAAVGGGAEGVKLAVEKMISELKVAMILTGTANLAAVSPRVLWQSEEAAELK
ncbi:MAG: alpha-hydroxy-acid oxidizing protein [Firmicutes bacterium]|jgi:4-hydroxymandelate oxidase|nr:alpha-hydroxy-acid oxidizing protein [Bacillota bacterium]